MNPRLTCVLRRLAATLAMLPALALAAPVQSDHVEAELIAEHTALATGDTDNWIALRLRPDPGWHVYWQNPGDSGIPTQLTWTLPAGVSAGAIHWPLPHRHSLAELTNYGYGEETLHLVPVRVAPGTASPVELQAEAKWLVCKDICIPGTAQLSLTLPIGTPQADPDWAEAFARARALLPAPANGASARYAVTATDFSLAVDGLELPAEAELEFFPATTELVNHAAPQRIVREAGGLRLSQALNAYFVEAPPAVPGVLVAHGASGTRAWQIEATSGAVEVVPAPAAPVATAPVEAATAAAAAEAADISLALVLVFAMTGGLILNLMPCVFPVLSLKALSVMQSRAQDHAYHRRHALAYTAGVVLSCVAVAGLLLGLRAGGAAIGWGFQLQSPAFVGLLVYLLFAMALSLSGAVQFGTSVMGIGESLTRAGGYAGSFFTGVLATVVASPCTAPFMGTALGYAVTQPAAVALLVFAALGLGLALPFLLLGLFPRLAVLLPRPGAWMETFKQAMAFPLYLSVAWLVWVLARQADANAAGLVLVGLVLIGFALWLWHRPGWLATGLKVAALAGALVLLSSPLMQVQAARAPTAAGELAWEPWSEARVAQLLGEGRTVFVDFTADWCITCKVNERVALGSTRVQQAFRERNVAYLVGDWTRADPAITRLLESFGRSGVPLYLVYRPGQPPQVLPQILTPDIVLAAID